MYEAFVLLGLFLLAILWCINDFKQWDRAIEKGCERIAKDEHVKRNYIKAKTKLVKVQTKKLEQGMQGIKPLIFVDLDKKETENEQDSEQDEDEQDEIDETFGEPIDVLEE